MRRALFALLVLAPIASAARPALAQGDRYGGYARSEPVTMAQQGAQPGRVLTWNGKQNAPAPAAYPQAQAYPQQAYPQQAYPQYPPQAYPPPQAYAPPQASPQMGYPQAYPPYAPPQAQAAPQGAPPVAYGQPGQGQEGVVLYPSISAGGYGQPGGGQRAQTPRYGNTRYGSPSYANQPPPPQQYPPGAYPQPGLAYPQMAAPPTGFVPTGYGNQVYPAAAYPQTYQAQLPQQPQPQYQPQPLAMPPPQGAWQMQGQPQGPAQGGATAAPTAPVTSQPLPTSIYAPPPRAENEAPASPSNGATAVAALDTRAVPRHYSVHRAFGIAPDPAPAPGKASNQVLIAAEAENPELNDPGLAGFRGVGEDEETATPAKAKKLKKASN